MMRRRRMEVPSRCSLIVRRGLGMPLLLRRRHASFVLLNTYVCNVLNELGYSGLMWHKSGAAPELRKLKKLEAAKRSCPTVPLEVPARESKANGAVERAVGTWLGVIRTLKSRLESGVDMTLPREHPILQWCAWCAASLLNRVAIKSHGRTVFEYATGHRMKTQLACFGKAVLWRAKRHAGALNK